MTVVLDWRHHRIGPSAPCIHCGHPAICRDEHQRPAHKTCAETLADQQQHTSTLTAAPAA